jgi:NitT/TauT family transport system ATP-binding protein
MSAISPQLAWFYPAPTAGNRSAVDMSHRYRRNSDLVLDSISFFAAPADRIAIIGRSGCGKSTLLQIIAGLIRPSSGAVKINGSVLTAPYQRCTLMFQRALLFPWLTVSQNIALALRFSGRDDEIRACAPRLLELVGLSSLGDARVQEISGGQQQRVALARSLAVDPETLLLDEPFSALDVLTRSELRQQIRAILDNLNLTFVLVTHEVDDALDLAERVIVMNPNPGRIVADIRLPSPLGDAERSELRASLLSALDTGALPSAIARAA